MCRIFIKCFAADLWAATAAAAQEMASVKGGPCTSLSPVGATGGRRMIIKMVNK